MALYNERGNIRVTVDDTSMPFGIYAADGSIRITVVDGSTFTGLYDTDGGYNVVVVEATDTPVSVYHPCGALRGVAATSETGLSAPNGAIYMDGLDTSARVIASAGSYIVTGTNSALAISYVALAASSGSYAVTGTAATLAASLSYSPDHLWSSLDGPLWQSSAGSTAVSANNDPVGYIGDSASGGTFHLIQATAGARPLYQTPSIGLSFDGSNDYLSCTSFGASNSNILKEDGFALLKEDGDNLLLDGASAGALTDTTGSLTILFKTGATLFISRGIQVLFSSADAGTTNNWFEVGITALGQIYIESNNGGTVHRMLGTTIMDQSTDYYLVIVHDGLGYTVFLNGVEQNPLVTDSEGTIGWFGDVSSADNLVAGGTVTSAGLVRPFEGIIREIATYATEII